MESFETEDFTKESFYGIYRNIIMHILYQVSCKGQQYERIL